MNTRAILCGMLTAVLGLGSTLPVMAEDMGGKMPMRQTMMKKHEEVMEEFYRAVNVTDMQKKQLDAMHQAFDAQMKPLRESMWKQRKDFMTYLASPAATPDGAMQREQALEKTKTQMNQMMIEHTFQKKAVLTPEQQDKAEDFVKQKMQEWETKHGDMMQEEMMPQ